jgi:anti-sigma factor RsiW
MDRTTRPTQSPEQEGNCGYLEQLSEFVDGELAPELCAELEQHIAQCENCRIVVDTLRQTITLYRALGANELELPTDVEERLWRKFDLEDLLKRTRSDTETKNES